MSRDKEYDKQTFDAVLRGVRGDNPVHKEATQAEKQQAKRIMDAQKKRLRAKFNSKQNGGGGDDVIDSGMFSS